MINISLFVKYSRSYDFAEKAKEAGGEIVNICEMERCEVLQYHISCPKEKEEVINELAFMTWIKNPVFQKLYKK